MGTGSFASSRLEVVSLSVGRGVAPSRRPVVGPPPMFGLVRDHGSATLSILLGLPDSGLSLNSVPTPPYHRPIPLWAALPVQIATSEVLYVLGR